MDILNLNLYIIKYTCKILLPVANIGLLGTLLIRKFLIEFHFGLGQVALDVKFQLVEFVIESRLGLHAPVGGGLGGQDQVDSVNFYDYGGRGETSIWDV